MAIENIIAKGIGFSPGSTRYIPTHGFDPGAYARSVSWDTDLGAHSAAAVSFDAALALRQSLTVSWDAELLSWSAKTVDWDADLAVPILETVNFDAALALRTLRTVSWDVSLGLRNTSVVNWNADLGLRVLLTVNWATVIAPRFTKTVSWDTIIGTVIVVIPPTDEEIADALSGRFRPVTTRYRYEKRNHSFVFQEDVTAAVESCSISLDNWQAITRTASFRLRTAQLGAFDPLSDHIAVFADIVIREQTIRFSLGLFHFDEVTDHLLPNGNEVWEASAADVTIHLWENTVTAPYSLPAGTVYTQAASQLVIANGLINAIPDSPAVTPVAFTWPVGTSHGEIINDLLYGINYYDVWADGEGKITSREKEDPSQAVADVTYTTGAEPRMIRPDFARRMGRARFLNEALMVVKDPGRAPASTRVTNSDPTSAVSTVSKGATTSNQFGADRVVDSATITDIGAWLVRDAAIKAGVASLLTHPDPRRDAHEFYTISIEGEEVATHWRVESWSLDCVAGADHQHEIGRADSVNVVVETVV